MTKLNVVIPAVNVMVEIGGNNVEFRKVDRKAKAGDIVKALRDYQDITEGAFYAVYADGDGDPAFRDDDGDERYVFLDHRDRYETFAPISAPTSAETTTITFENAQYRKVDRSAREGDVIVITEPDDAEYTADEGIALGTPYLVAHLDCADDPQITNVRGKEYDTAGDSFDVYEKVSEEYREVKRKAAVGERIKIVDAFSLSDYENGDEFEVVRVDEDGDIHIVDNEGDSECVMPNEYVVLELVNAQDKVEPAAQPKRLTVGDYAKVIESGAGFPVGTIVKITVDDHSNIPYKTEDAKGEQHWAQERRLIPATEAEFLAQRKPAEPVRLNVGDYAKVIGWGNVLLEVGDIVKLTAITHDVSDAFDIADMLGNPIHGCKMAKNLTPATAEEVSAAKAEAQHKLAIGPFAGGGFAVVVDESKSGSLNGFENGQYVTVADKYGYAGLYALKVTLPGGFYGYCDADALRQITEAEYTAATAPKPKFSVSDSVRLTIADGKSPKYGWGGVKNGDVGTVIEILPDKVRVAFPKQSRWNAKPEELAKVTAEEIAALASIEKEAQETAKWNAIGRKVGEFKRGDIVEVTNGSGLPVCSIKSGDIVTVGEVCAFDDTFRLVAPGVTSSNWADATIVKLVTPVEQRFDTLSAA